MGIHGKLFVFVTGVGIPTPLARWYIQYHVFFPGTKVIQNMTWTFWDKVPTLFFTLLKSLGALLLLSTLTSSPSSRGGGRALGRAKRARQSGRSNGHGETVGPEDLGESNVE